MGKNVLAVAGAAVLVAGVIVGGTAFAQTRASHPGPENTSTTTQVQTGTGAKAQTAAGASARPWTNKTVFMQVKSGVVRGGTYYLQVRPAKKRILGESFETVSIPGPYTEVAMTAHSRTLLLDGESGSPEVFLIDLKRRTASQADEAFDITFDKKGKVTTVEWLYVKSPDKKAPAPTKSPSWKNKTVFMQVTSGVVRGGTYYLKVRPAKKRILGESFETVSIPGPYTEVAMTAHSRTLLLDGESGSPEVFLDDLKRRTASQADEAFDITFDKKGKITTVEWLYVF
jgi:hypothetical protein